MKRILSTILALALLVSLVPAVFAAGESAGTARTHEYVIGLSAFNTADLKTRASKNTGVPELYNGGMYHTASMKWDAVVSGDYTTSGTAIDPFMDLTKTDKWSFVGTTHTSQNPYLANDHLYTQVGSSSLGTSYVAFKIYVETPGDYKLQIKNMEGAPGERGAGHHLDPKVYFFKDGTAGVTNTSKGTYPEDALVGKFVYDADLVGKYDTVDEVNVPEAGEYIVAFTCDSTSPSVYTGNASPYQLSIGGIKLLADEVSAISVSAENTELAKGKTETLSLNATYTLSGVKPLAASDVNFTVAPEGVVSISDDGVVTALTAGTATVTASFGGKTATISFTVSSNPRTHEYIIGLSAFNTSDLKTVAGFYDGALYNQASMAWDAVIDGANTTSGNPIDPFMNLSVTDKWAFAGTNMNRRTAFLSEDHMYSEIGKGSFVANEVFHAYKIYVDAPGDYVLEAKSILDTSFGASGIKPVVYFFADGTETVSKPKQYSSAAKKVGYLDSDFDGEYDTIGEINIPAAGTYVVSFVGDQQTYSNLGTSPYQISIGGIKLAVEGAEEPVVPGNPNAEITDKDVSIALTAIVNGVASPEAKALLSESTVTAGMINSVTIGSTVTLKAKDSETLKFLYWYNGNSGRMISDAATYTFTAGTNTPIFAKYADVNEELTEYFSTAGQLMEKDKGTFDAEPNRKLGDYYKLFKDKTAGVASTLVNEISEAANFVCWKKNNEIVSYDSTYSFWTWADVTDAVEVTEGEKSDAPAVVLFENAGAYMLELVNFEGKTIIEKGILFGGDLTISRCEEKAVALEDTKQFTASPKNATTARAYVIYRDGATIRVAYSK